jgi:hypothetical protein
MERILYSLISFFSSLFSLSFISYFSSLSIYIYGVKGILGKH